MRASIHIRHLKHARALAKLNLRHVRALAKLNLRHVRALAKLNLRHVRALAKLDLSHALAKLNLSKPEACHSPRSLSTTAAAASGNSTVSTDKRETKER